MSTAHTTIAYIPTSHLDLFWLGNYKTTLERGAAVIKQYLDRVLSTPDETFFLETTVFAGYFLHRYPEYQEPLRRLVRERRVEVGTAYIDRWEHLTPAESQIRNIIFGKLWSREALGIDNRLTTHPDLPGLIPQIPQLYAQAGVEFYVTSRKLFEPGAVWRYRAPDGSELIMLNYPKHYIYTDIAETPVENSSDWWRKTMDLEQTRQGFPLGTVLVAGSASDLTDRETFRERYGAYLEELVEQNRQRYADLDFVYRTPSQVLEPYREAENLPVLSGEVPSVWGVAADEEVAFFRRDRALEAKLLSAEALAAVANHLGLNWLPEDSRDWQGVFYESAFFAAKDPIPAGAELAELWRMHVFTQDHNGGGYEGVLSSFQKRVIQERCAAYADEIIDHTLDQLGARLTLSGDALLVFNTDGREWSGPLTVALSRAQWSAGRPLGEDGQPLPAQLVSEDDDTVQVALQLQDVPAVGYRAYPLGPADVEGESPAAAAGGDGLVTLESADIAIAIDRSSGALVRIHDLRRDVEWGGPQVGRISAYRELGSDVTLRMDPDAPATVASLESVGSAEQGPLFARVVIRKRLFDAPVEQTVTLWLRSGRVDLQTRILWWGKRNLQIRQDLPSAPVERIAYGTPFYGSGWTDIVADAAPRNPDEILPEDYAHYREVQGWLHLRGESGGLAIVTDHPGFYHGDDGLAAVLMRTSPSCGDKRLFWENAGEQIYSFSLLPGAADWRASDTIREAAQLLRPPRARLIGGAGTGDLAAATSFLSIDSTGVQLSALLPAAASGATALRIYETRGAVDQVSLRGPLAQGSAAAVDLLQEHGEPLASEGGAQKLTLTPWRIQTVLIERAGNAVGSHN